MKDSASVLYDLLRTGKNVDIFLGYLSARKMAQKCEKDCLMVTESNSLDRATFFGRFLAFCSYLSCKQSTIQGVVQTTASKSPL
jgi:lipopolysaccharide/colanic/teichoic acid biosynthesis glycosyltransferase